MRQVKITRDLAVACVALSLLAYEVVVGGGRAPVLVALAGLLVSPAVMRVDEARKERNGKHRADDTEGEANAAP